MAVNWQKTSFLGVRYREHKTRKHGIRFDRCFSIRYKLDGKDKEESVGWSSEGITAEKASQLLSIIRENIRQGKGPQSIKELREENIETAEREAKEKEEAHNKSITFNDFWESTYLPHAESYKKETTISGEKTLYRTWIEPSFGELPLFKLDVPMLEKLMRKMKSLKKTPATIRTVFALISQIWSKAVQYGIIEGECPTRKIKKPQQDNRRMRFLSKEEASRLLEALARRSKDMHDISLLSLFCGLRAGEIHALTWGDVNLDTNTILIRDPKSGKNRHAIIINEVKEMLLSRRKEQAKTDLVFPAKGGKQRRWVSDTFQRTADAIGLNDTGEFVEGDDGNKIPVLISDARQKVVFHSLRHTFASWLVQNGTPIYTVAELMGHSTLEMTQRYSHLSPDTLRVAAQGLEDFLK